VGRWLTVIFVTWFEALLTEKVNCGLIGPGTGLLTTKDKNSGKVWSG